MTRHGSTYRLWMMACLAITGATAAFGQDSPFADVEDLCSQKFTDFPTAVDAFVARGWKTNQTDASDKIIDLMYLTVVYNIDPSGDLTSERIAEDFSRSTKRALQELGMTFEKKAVLTYPGRDDLSPLIFAFEQRGSGGKKTATISHCVLAGSAEVETDWLGGHADAGTLQDEFNTFDASKENFTHSALANTLDANESAVQSAVLRFSRDRIEQALPRPMPYDLQYSIATAYFEER